MHTVIQLISIFLLAAFIHTTLSAPVLLSRQSSSSATNATINATVLDHTGRDITSSFQIRVYQPDSSATFVTNNSLSNRQTVSHARPLHSCSDYGIFMESFCTPADNKPGSLQSYTIVCHYLVPAPDPYEFPEPILGDYVPIAFVPDQAIEARRRDGHCADNEICVPGLGSGKSRSGRRMASCVRTDFFIKYINWGKNFQRDPSFEGMKASLVASQLDGTTPLEVDTFEVDAHTTGSSSGQNKKCRDCVELATDKFNAKTESLKVQTKLLTTGAMAGVLWLAITSG